MGLAASQARLLSITSRKSDCEYQSMRLSHQKIALSRDLTDLSNEHQNSLTLTKLVYDYYGTGDTSTPLSYSLMMTPSALNDYAPILLTNAEGRVVLNDKYAEAARAAGIPQEGIAGLPSDLVRNKFLQALGEQGIISQLMAETLQKTVYSNTVGVGEVGDVSILTEQGNIDALKKRLIEEVGGTYLDLPKFTAEETGASPDAKPKHYDGGPYGGDYDPSELLVFDANGTNLKGTNGRDKEDSDPVSLDDLLGENQYVWLAADWNMHGNTACENFAEYLETTFIPWISEQLSSVLDIGDEKQAAALDYALTETMALYGDIVDGGNKIEIGGKDKNWDDNVKHAVSGSDQGENFGYTLGIRHHDSWWYKIFGNDCTAVSVNLNNIVDAYLTFFADSLGNLNTDYHISSGYNSRASSTVVTDDKDYLYTFKVGSSVSGTSANMALFYDALFNQLCSRGWVESAKDKVGNSLVNDPEYVQEMLQNGMMFITSVEDDGYYYQGNYATNTYIKEVADEDAIALAEARYQTEKAKITSKEETLDMKMKNLDTEISSLTTEYDTVKSVISKNIEKSFKRYQA